MPKYVVYNTKSGETTKFYDMSSSLIKLQLGPDEDYIISEEGKPGDYVDKISKQLVKSTKPEILDLPLREGPEYALNRINNYPSIGSQLDMLWRAMDKGEIPKAAEFYDAIKLVKASIPKEDKSAPVIIYPLQST